MDDQDRVERRTGGAATEARTSRFEDDIKGDVVVHALGSMQGFTFVRAGAKAWSTASS